MVPVEVAIERLRNPKPGGKIWAAREYGVDLTLLIEAPQRTPEERVRFAQRRANARRNDSGRRRKSTMREQIVEQLAKQGVAAVRLTYWKKYMELAG